jgi:glycosyltransferase involved in cell wall biosynthesis
MSARCEFTIMTATWNRAHTLPRLFQSLCRQSCRDFEWFVVNDGSTDSTAELIRSLSINADFPIHYREQSHSGKHVAINTALAGAHGTFSLILDSDDWLLPDSLKRYLAIWDSIPVSERGAFAGVAGRCAFANGSLVGSPWPSDLIDSTAVEIRTRWGIRGDLSEMARTTLMQEFPLPVFPGETFLSDGILWYRLTRKHRMRYVNEPLYFVEYQSNGLSALARELMLANPRGAFANSKEWIAAANDLSPLETLRAYTRLTRYGWLAGLSTGEVMSAARSRTLWVTALPLAMAARFRDVLNRLRIAE